MSDALGVPTDLETLNFLCVLCTHVPTSPVRMKAYRLIAYPYLLSNLGAI